MTGSCEAGLTVTLGGSVTGGHTTSCAAGNFSFASWILSTGNGSKSVTVSQTDAAMNVGTSSARSFTFPQPPTAPTLTAANVAGLKPAFALVPLSKFHLTRYYGVFAKASKHRNKLPERPPPIFPAKRTGLWGEGQTLVTWDREGFDVSESDNASNSHSFIDGDFYPD